MGCGALGRRVRQTEVETVIKRILTPTDGSETARGAVQYARDIAKAEGAEVVVFAAAHAVQYGDTTDVDVSGELKDDLEKVVEAEASEFTAAGVKATTMVTDDDNVQKAIVDAAVESGADLIVMGTHGRSGFTRAMIGSVADAVVKHSEIPVLLVPMKQ